MYENDYLYAVERDGAYLAHYGVKGMKWGVRKAIERGNDRALSRQYRKAAKKLAKLEKRAASGKKYAKRAALLGAGAAGAAGLAATGVGGVRKVLGVGGAGINAAGHGLSNLGGLARSSRNKKIRQIGMALDTAGRSVSSAGNVVKGNKVGKAVSEWGAKSQNLGKAGKVVGNAAGDVVYNTRRGLGSLAARTGTHGAINQNFGKVGARMTGVENKLRSGSLTNNQIVRLGSAAAGLGLAGAAGYNAYRAATAKRNARKAAQFRSEMNKAFAGTKYANGGGNRQGGRRRKRR